MGRRRGFFAELHHQAEQREREQERGEHKYGALRRVVQPPKPEECEGWSSRGTACSERNLDDS